MPLMYADYLFSQSDFKFSNGSHFGTFLFYAFLSI